MERVWMITTRAQPSGLGGNWIRDHADSLDRD